jgi:hypothetical protein
MFRPVLVITVSLGLHEMHAAKNNTVTGNTYFIITHKKPAPELGYRPDTKKAVKSILLDLPAL